MSALHFKPLATCKGFNLLEVLIATSIFSIGLAGLTSLLLATTISSAEARYSSVAAIAAANLAEQIRLNPAARGRYLSPPAQISLLCMRTELCTPDQQADYDFRMWQIELANRIRSASGLVCHDTTPLDGVEGNGACDGSGPLVIKIFWGGSGGQNTNPQRLTLEVG